MPDNNEEFTTEEVLDVSAPAEEGGGTTETAETTSGGQSAADIIAARNAAREAERQAAESGLDPKVAASLREAETSVNVEEEIPVPTPEPQEQEQQQQQQQQQQQTQELNNENNNTQTNEQIVNVTPEVNNNINVETPEVNVNVETPEVNVNVDTPEVNNNITVETPEVNNNINVETPEVNNNITVETPEVNVDNNITVETPDVNVNIEGGGEQQQQQQQSQELNNENTLEQTNNQEVNVNNIINFPENPSAIEPTTAGLVIQNPDGSTVTLDASAANGGVNQQLIMNFIVNNYNNITNNQTNVEVSGDNNQIGVEQITADDSSSVNIDDSVNIEGDNNVVTDDNGKTDIDVDVKVEENKPQTPPPVIPTPTPDPGPTPGPGPDPEPTPGPGPDPTPDPGPTPDPEPTPTPQPTPNPQPTDTPEPEIIVTGHSTGGDRQAADETEVHDFFQLCMDTLAYKFGFPVDKLAEFCGMTEKLQAAGYRIPGVDDQRGLDAAESEAYNHVLLEQEGVTLNGVDAEREAALMETTQFHGEQYPNFNSTDPNNLGYTVDEYAAMTREVIQKQEAINAYQADGTLPDGVDAETMDAYCAEQEAYMQEHTHSLVYSDTEWLGMTDEQRLAAQTAEAGVASVYLIEVNGNESEMNARLQALDDVEAGAGQLPGMIQMCAENGVQLPDSVTEWAAQKSEYYAMLEAQEQAQSEGNSLDHATYAWDVDATNLNQENDNVEAPDTREDRNRTVQAYFGDVVNNTGHERGGAQVGDD